MNKKIAILFIIGGIVGTIIVSIFLQTQYNNQETWIAVDAYLDEIKTTTPISQGGTFPDGYRYYGLYKATINGEAYTLRSHFFSDPQYIDMHTTFYVNPANYSDYHEEYSANTKYRGLSCLLFTIIGILYLVLNRPE